MIHVVAGLTLEAQGLLLGGFGELFLKRIFLSAVPFFFSIVMAFTFCHGAAFAGFVEGDSVSLMNFTFWTVSLYFFRNVHGIDQLCIKETYAFLYFFTYQAKTKDQRIITLKKNAF